MEYGLLSGRCDRENRPAVVRAAGLRRAVERALEVDEARSGVFAVSRAAREAMEHRFLARRRDRKDRPFLLRAPFVGRAVERAVDVREARKRKFAVLTVEAVEHGLFAGRRNREDRSTSGNAATNPARTRTEYLCCAVERAVDVKEARERPCAVCKAAAETVEHAVCGTRVRSLLRNSGTRWAQRHAASAAAAREQHSGNASTEGVPAKTKAFHAPRSPGPRNGSMANDVRP